MKIGQLVISLILGVLLLTSCGEVKEEVWLDANDNINMTVTWDMTKQSSDGSVSLSSLFGQLSSMLPSSVNENLLKTITAQIGIPYNGSGKIDSTIFFKNIALLQYNNLLSTLKEKDTENALSNKEKEEFAAAVNRFSRSGYAQCIINTSKSIYKIIIKTGTFSSSDYKIMSSALYKLDKTYKLGAQNVFNGSEGGILFSINNKGVKRGSCDYAHLIDMTSGSRFAEDKEMQLIFGDGKSYNQVSIFHLPKQFKSATNPMTKTSADRTIVTTTISAAKMESGSTLENLIIYK